MLKINLVCFYMFCLTFIISCGIKQNNQNINTDCEIIGMVYDTFMQTYQNEFKYMKLNSFYICQFDSIKLDTALRLQNKPHFSTIDNVLFKEDDLREIGMVCLQIPKIKVIDSESALDSLMFTKTTNKIIWGVTNYQKNSKYAYLIFGGYFSRKAGIADQYLLEYKNGKYEIIDIVQ